MSARLRQKKQQEQEQEPEPEPQRPLIFNKNYTPRLLKALVVAKRNGSKEMLGEVKDRREKSQFNTLFDNVHLGGVLSYKIYQEYGLLWAENPNDLPLANEVPNGKWFIVMAAADDNVEHALAGDVPAGHTPAGDDFAVLQFLSVDVFGNIQKWLQDEKLGWQDKLEYGRKIIELLYKHCIHGNWRAFYQRNQAKIREMEVLAKKKLEDVEKDKNVVKKRDKEIAKKDKVIGKTVEEVVKKKDKEIAHFKNLIAHMADETAERDEEIAEKDEEIADMAKEIAEKDEKIAEMAKELAFVREVKDEKIAEMDEKLADKDEKIADMAEEVAYLKKLLKVYGSEVRKPDP